MFASKIVGEMVKYLQDKQYSILGNMEFEWDGRVCRVDLYTGNRDSRDTNSVVTFARSCTLS